MRADSFLLFLLLILNSGCLKDFNEGNQSCVFPNVESIECVALSVIPDLDISTNSFCSGGQIRVESDGGTFQADRVAIFHENSEVYELDWWVVFEGGVEVFDLPTTLEANCCYSVRVVSGVGQPGEFWRSTPHFCIAE
ncbi:MAG: hypothetical protein OSA78_05745 [Flavobacteriales bacterium]|nr:hypothetical protein [Flavobacteriales bacterium]